MPRYVQQNLKYYSASMFVPLDNCRHLHHKFLFKSSIATYVFEEHKPPNESWSNIHHKFLTLRQQSCCTKLQLERLKQHALEMVGQFSFDFAQMLNIPFLQILYIVLCCKIWHITNLKSQIVSF